MSAALRPSTTPELERGRLPEPGCLRAARHARTRSAPDRSDPISLTSDDTSSGGNDDTQGVEADAIARGKHNDGTAASTPEPGTVALSVTMEASLGIREKASARPLPDLMRFTRRIRRRRACTEYGECGRNEDDSTERVCHEAIIDSHVSPLHPSPSSLAGHDYKAAEVQGEDVEFGPERGQCESPLLDRLS